MSKITVINHLTLDGVMQAPGAPDEDQRDGFEHGGWAIPNNHEVMGSLMGERMAAAIAGTQNAAERRFLRRRREGLGDPSRPPS